MAYLVPFKEVDQLYDTVFNVPHPLFLDPKTLLHVDNDLSKPTKEVLFNIYPGTTLIAPESGIVREVKHDPLTRGMAAAHATNYVRVEHGDGNSTTLYHLDPTVSLGQEIIQGERVGFAKFYLGYPHIHMTSDRPITFDNLPDWRKNYIYHATNAILRSSYPDKTLTEIRRDRIYNIMRARQARLFVGEQQKPGESLEDFVARMEQIADEKDRQRLLRGEQPSLQ